MAFASIPAALSAAAVDRRKRVTRLDYGSLGSSALSGGASMDRSIGWYRFGTTPRGASATLARYAASGAIGGLVVGSGLPPDHARHMHGGPLASPARCRDAASVEARCDGPQRLWPPARSSARSARDQPPARRRRARATAALPPCFFLRSTQVMIAAKLGAVSFRSRQRHIANRQRLIGTNIVDKYRQRRSRATSAIPTPTLIFLAALQQCRSVAVPEADYPSR